MKGTIKMGGVISVLVKHEDASAGIQRILPKKCQDQGIFVVPCTIDDRTFTDAMLDLGAVINILQGSIYKSLNLRDLELTGMEIQLANRRVVQPLGVLEDVNDLIFLADFYVLDMEDEALGQGSALIFGRPFLMIAKAKIDIHAGTLSIEFGDSYMKFNIVEAMKHPYKDHSIFSIDAIDGLIEEYFRIGIGSVNLVDFVDIYDVINCFCTVVEKVDSLDRLKVFFNSSEPFIVYSDASDMSLSDVLMLKDLRLKLSMWGYFKEHEVGYVEDV
ncbi:hypothetical protein CR513_43471, partial [Mucuna pruriens]